MERTLLIESMWGVLIQLVQVCELGLLPKERTLGGKGATGQDVSIILVRNGGTKDHKLACIRLHSGVLRTHSKYFRTCLSERWNGPGPASPIEFVLEALTGVEFYFDCFSRMYSPFKSFESVEQALEILKVASQIDFQELVERISLYLSCKHWSEEDDVLRVREYFASPDFPRINLKYLVDLFARLGMNASKEHSIRECTRAVFKACCEKGESFPEYLKGIGRGPSSEFSRMVIGVVNDEAKKMFVKIANEWNGKTPANNGGWDFDYKLGAMKWILKTLLDEGVAEELLRGIVHLGVIPKYTYEVHQYRQRSLETPRRCVLDLSVVVLRIYNEVAAGRLLLKSPERFALFANWHYKTPNITETEFNEAAAKLFLTLSLEEQVELVKSRGELVRSCMGKLSLVTMVSRLQLYQSFA